MPPQDVQAHRKQRLADLLSARYANNKAELGRALGYKDGAFVRQMLAGERPITEKAVLAWESNATLKLAGWFTAAQPAAQPPADARFVQTTKDLAILPASRRAEWLRLIHEEAEAIREAARQLVQEQQHDTATSAMPATKQRAASSRLRITVTDAASSPKQAMLPLITVDDPHKAQPEPNERAFYARLAKDERHPK